MHQLTISYELFNKQKSWAWINLGYSLTSVTKTYAYTLDTKGLTVQLPWSNHDNKWFLVIGIGDIISASHEFWITIQQA